MPMPFGASLYIAGWAHYRDGNYELAVKNLEDACQDCSPNREIGTPVLAMAYHKLGQHANADAALERANSQMDKWLDMAIQSERSTAIPWVDWIEFLVNHREATTMITGESAAEDPRLMKIAERSMAALK